MTNNAVQTPTDLPEGSPFAHPWSLPLGLPDFSAVKHADIEPAVRVGMAVQRSEWEAIATNPATPTIANTVDAVELSGDLLERALTVLFSLTSATYCPDLDKLEEALMPELAAHQDAFGLDQRLYQRFKALQEIGQGNADADGKVIDSETARLVQLTVEKFERDGVALSGAVADRLRALNSQISALESRYSTMVTDAMHAAGTANYTATPELASMSNHDERVALLEKSMARCFSGEYDTRPLVVELAQLRAERAQLLGFEHHGATVAAESAAKTSQAVSQMLGQLALPAMANARRDAADLAQRMATDPQTPAGAQFGPADWSYYEEAKRKELFGVDDEILAPYLELWNVVEKGVFYAANKLYGLTFHERTDLAQYMYDPSVRVWEVRDGGAVEGTEEEAPVLALFVGDYFAREGKNGGAWMNEFQGQSGMENQRPVIVNCCNIEQPADGKPALLSWDNVITCFHEFGHALHGMLSDTHYPSIAGTSVPRDVVEFPSQVNEQWALHPEVLASYAHHVETGEQLPAEITEQLRNQGSFGEGYATTEYLGAALLDQAWHTLAPAAVPTDPEQVEAFEHAALAAVGIDDAVVPPRYRTTYFSHVFGGGYDAAYYAYIWSEVMDADTVEWFKASENLGLNRESGEAFRREFLCRGDSREPLVSYRAFRGADPALEPLLVRRGLAQPTE